MEVTRILIVDDQEKVRQAFRSLLSPHQDLSICGEACDGIEAIEKAKALKPDVILMDVSMPRMDGISATRILHKELPESDVIIVSQNDPAVVRRQSREASARGYVAKGNIGLELLPAIERLLEIRREWSSSSESSARSTRSSAPSASSSQQKTEVVSAKRQKEHTQDGQATALLAAIIDSSDDAIVSKDLDGTITSWNKSAERLFGYTPEEAVGQNISLVIPPERRDEEVAIISRLRRGERVDHFETVRLRKDGTRFDVSLTISPVKDSTGTIFGASKIARDIGERKRNEEARLEQARLLDITRDAILVRDVHDKITYWNHGASELYGYSPEEALGQTSHDLLKTLFSEPQEIITDKMNRDSRWTGDLVHFRKDGAQIVVISRWQADRDADGNVKTVLETNNDVTNQRQSEAQLRESERQLRELAGDLETQVDLRTQELEQRNAEILEQSERLRDLSNRLLKTQDDERRRLARELHDSAGQIITALSMGLANMGQQIRQNPPLAKALEDSQELVQQLNKEIRTMSYLLHPPLLDESGLSGAISWYMEGLKERSGLKIELSIAEGFGRLPAEMELALFRVVQECITNIIRHSGSANAAVRISRGAKEVSLNITDNGRGINPDRLADIRSQRSGVGLTGIRERVRQLHGVMNIQSDEHGTQVSVVLPVPSSEAVSVADERATVSGRN